jgi:hypothetical protein
MMVTVKRDCLVEGCYFLARSYSLVGTSDSDSDWQSGCTFYMPFDFSLFNIEYSSHLSYQSFKCTLAEAQQPQLWGLVVDHW